MLMLTRTIFNRHLVVDAKVNTKAPARAVVLGYSRRDMLTSLHRSARVSSPFDSKYEGKDHLGCQCTIIGRDGVIQRMKTPLLKQTLIDAWGLSPRELRSLDSHLLDVRPTLVVSKSIVFVSPIFRAVISFDRALILGVDGRNPLATEEDNDALIESIVRSMDALPNGQPFELRMLEAMLMTTIRGFQEVVHNLNQLTHSKILPELRARVTPRDLTRLMETKRAVDDCIFTGRALQTAISNVLAEDEDLMALSLTDQQENKLRPTGDHQQAELMLEYVERRLDEINESASRLSLLLKNLDSNISLVLQSSRLKLQNLELQTAIGALSFASGTAVAGVFGQNLVSGLESHPMAFWGATGFAAFTVSSIAIIGLVRLRRANRSYLGGHLLWSSNSKRSLTESLADEDHTK